MYIALIVIISKYMLVKILRNLAETLNLRPKTIGNITGIATSIPEFLTVVMSNLAGLASTSIYNVLSSNIINFIQYILAITLNKNIKILKNKALKIDILIVLITILIPLYMIKSNIKTGIPFALFLIILFIFFYKINSNAHKLYLKKYETQIDEKQEKIYLEEVKWKKGKKHLIIKYTIYLIIVGILLFIVGEGLSGTLKNLFNIFTVPEYIIGIILGFGTSLPELITFFESQKSEKNKNDKMLGVIETTNNLLTSNMINLFIILSIGIILK